MNKTTLKVEAGKQEIFIFREFEAPRDLVFRTLTDPALLAQWMNPFNMTSEIHRYDAISGGAYRYTQTDPKGGKHLYFGAFHEVTAPERIIRTFEYLNLPERGHVHLDTFRLEALSGNRTRLTIHTVYPSVSDRNTATRPGMEQFIAESYNLLDQLLEKQQKKQ